MFQAQYKTKYDAHQIGAKIERFHNFLIEHICDTQRWLDQEDGDDEEYKNYLIEELKQRKHLRETFHDMFKLIMQD